jgi:lipopolysaccharide export system permease protein
MRLLDRYLLRELLLPFGYCLGGFTVLWLAADLLSRLDDFKEHGKSAIEVAQYYFWGFPEVLSLILPIALLLAALYALTNHSRHNEITAIRSAGISLWRMSAAYIAAGIGASLLLTFSNEWIQPKAAQRLRDMEDAKSNQGGVHPNLVFKNAIDGRVWNAESFNLDTGEMTRPFVIWRMPSGERREIFSQRATHGDDAWTFDSVQVVIYAADDPIPQSNIRTNRLVFPGWRETPESIRSEIKISSLSSANAAKGAQLSFQEIRDYLARNPDLPRGKVQILETQFQARLSEPWRCLVVILVAVPFGAAGGRRGKFVGVASSIFIVFAYLIFLRLGLALGTGGYLSPLLAAWVPNLVFALTGAILITRTR